MGCLLQTVPFQAPHFLLPVLLTVGVEERRRNRIKHLRAKSSKDRSLHFGPRWDGSEEWRVPMTMSQQRTQSLTCTATPDPDTCGILPSGGLTARTEGTCALSLGASWWWSDAPVRICLPTPQQAGSSSTQFCIVYFLSPAWIPQLASHT